MSEEGPLLNVTGHLVESGWSPVPLKRVEPASFGKVVLGFKYLTFLKYFRSDEYVAFSSRNIIAVTARQNAFFSEVTIAVYDREEKTLTYHEKAQFGKFKKHDQLEDNIHFCPLNHIDLSKNPFAASIETSSSTEGCVTNIKFTTDSGAVTSIKITRNSTQEALEEIAPISADTRFWQHSFKSVGQPAAIESEGKTAVGLAAISYTRGLAYYKTVNMWGAAAGKIDKKRFGLNFGILNGHNSTKTIEDSFTYDGVTHKLDPLEIKYDKLNFMNGFTLFTAGKNNSVDEGLEIPKSGAELVFRTVFHQNVGWNYWIARRQTDLVFGELSGWVTDSEGKKLSFNDIPAYIRLNNFKS